MKNMRTQLAEAKVIQKYWEALFGVAADAPSPRDFLRWVQTYSEEKIHAAIDAAAKRFAGKTALVKVNPKYGQPGQSYSWIAQPEVGKEANV